MHYNLYFKALEVLKGKDIDEFIGGNDISSLFEKYDEDDVLLLRGIEAYLLRNLYGKKELVRKVSKQIYRAFIGNPCKYFDSFLLNDMSLRSLFSFFEVRKIKRTMKNLEIQAKDIMKRGPKGSLEFRFLMKYMKMHVDLDDEYQKKYISKIITKKVSDLDEEEYNFLCVYVGKWMLKESGNEKVDFDLFVANFPDSRDDGGYANGKVIVVRILDDDYDIPCVIRNVCHEVEHIIQRSMFGELFASGDGKHKDTEVGLDYFEHVRMGNDYYHKNYLFSRVEYDAEKSGIKYALKFLSSFGKECSANIFDDSSFLSFKSYEFRLQPICASGEYEKEFAEPSRVSNFDSIIKKYPSLIDYYPILRKFYYYNGERVSFDEMLSNDFSLDDNLGIFYDFVFDYIQSGKLDGYIAGDLQLRNIHLVYDKVYERILLMFSSSFDLSSLDFCSFSNISLSSKEIEDVFTAEVIYYFSFLCKVSKYMHANIRRFSEADRNDFFSKVDGILDKIQYVLNDYVLDFRKGSLKFLENNFTDLSYIYNDLRKDEIRKFMESRFELIVPSSLWNLSYGDSTVKDYICDNLYLNVSYDDISMLEVDGGSFKIDDYIILLISKCLGYDVGDILCLLNLIRQPILEEDVRELFFEKYDKLSLPFRDDSEFFCVLKNALKEANEEYGENILNKTAIDIDLGNFASEIESVMSK